VQRQSQPEVRVEAASRVPVDELVAVEHLDHGALGLPSPILLPDDVGRGAATAIPPSLAGGQPGPMSAAEPGERCAASPSDLGGASGHPSGVGEPGNTIAGGRYQTGSQSVMILRYMTGAVKAGCTAAVYRTGDVRTSSPSRSAS
jgi:hypothetical protein